MVHGSNLITSGNVVKSYDLTAVSQDRQLLFYIIKTKTILLPILKENLNETSQFFFYEIVITFCQSVYNRKGAISIRRGWKIMDLVKSVSILLGATDF